MPAIFSPIHETTRGLKAYTLGLGWLRKHPRSLALLFIPMLVGFGLFISGWSLFFRYDDLVFEWILFARPETWYMLALYYVCKFLLYFSFLVIGMVSLVLVANVLACPIYEHVSLAIERDIRGEKVEELSLWQSIKLMGEETKKVLFVITVSVLLLFIPGLNILTTLVTAFLVGWDFYDYPLARRGWSFKDRLVFVSRDSWAVMGLGLWLMIPFVQFFLIPMAVAGGTLLSLESMEKRKLFTIRAKEGA